MVPQTPSKDDWKLINESPKATESDNCSLAKSETLQAKEEALQLASLGWSVFPVVTGGKSPATKHGFKDASHDPALICTMFGETNYNIGIATGQTSGGIIVIDADVKPDQNKNGIEVIQQWQESYGAWPTTVEAESGSGGRHWYFKTSTEIRNSTNGELGVDIRGDGGYIIAPPSIHPNGNLYTWLPGLSPHEHEVAEVNDSVSQFIEHITGKAQHNAWKKKDYVPEGTRDDELFRACCSWRARGYSYEAILKMAHEYNEQTFDPPLSDDEVIAKVNHVTKTYATEQVAYRRNDLLEHIKERGVSTATLNDKDLGRLFGELYKDKLCYDSKGRNYLFYNGRYWEVDLEGLFAELLCKQFVDLLWEHRVNISEDNQEKYRAALKKYRGRSARERLLKDSRSELRVDPSLLNANSSLLNVANCTIDLKTRQPYPQQAADLLTQCAPADYVPEATCELWESVLASAFEGDTDTMRYFQKAIGMAILGDTSKALFHIAGFTPRSGKSVIFSVLTNMLGSESSGYACVIPGSTFEQSRKPNCGAAREDLMLMRGTRLAVVHESSQGMILDAALIKQITGGDLVSARSNYKSFETFVLSCNIFFVTNYMPQITDRTVFTSGRLRIIPFTNAVLPQDQNPALKSILSEPANLSGVLNWALEGVRLYQEEGLDTPRKITSAILLAESSTDYIQQFIEEALTKTGETRHPLSQIHKAYRDWCKQKGISGLMKDDFRVELESHGITIGARTAALRDPILGYTLTVDSSLNPPMTEMTILN